MKNKSIFQQVKTGIIKGWNTPTLPDRILELQNQPLMRIFRFLGGVSYLILLGKSFIPSTFIIKIIAFIIAAFFLLYHFYITYHRIKHVRYLFKSGKLDIRNSPLQRLSTLIGKALVCVKSGCDTAQPVGLTLGLMLGADEVLKASNRDPLFTPFLGSLLNSVLPENTKKTNFKILVGKSVDEIENESAEIKDVKKALSRLTERVKTGGLSKADYNELSKSFNEVLTNSSERQKELANEIAKILDDTNNK